MPSAVLEGGAPGETEAGGCRVQTEVEMEDEATAQGHGRGRKDPPLEPAPTMRPLASRATNLHTPGLWS